MREIDSPSGAQWEIASGVHRAVIVEVGGGLRSFTVDGVEVIDGYAADEMCPGASGQILAPWPNRIRDGKYAWHGDAHQLTLTEPELHNATHGLTRWLTWHVVESSPTSVTVGCDLPAQPGYPWALRLRTTWTVSDDGLRADHEATNTSATSAPFGLGVHPYVRIIGASFEDLILTIPAHSRLLVDGRMLPMGAAKVAGGPYDFVAPRRIGDTRLDTAFGEVIRDEDGLSRARLATADGSSVREIWADGAFSWWQVYSGDTLQGERLRRSVAMEPMTCPPDAFRSGRDVVTLEPGAAWHGSWGIKASV